MREFVFDNVTLRTSDHWSDVSFWFLPDHEGMKPRVIAPNEEEYMEILIYPRRQVLDINEMHSLLADESDKHHYPPPRSDAVEDDFMVAASFKEEQAERFHRIWWLCRKNTTVCLMFHGELEHYDDSLKECDEIVRSINIE